MVMKKCVDCGCRRAFSSPPYGNKRCFKCYSKERAGDVEWKR